MRIAVLSGAGMSAESGVPTFRDAQTGLWARFDAHALATPEAFARDPALVWGWYAWRAAAVSRARPHAGHRALAALARRHALTVVTQNVDDLHERAGSTGVVHLHGALFTSRCSRCARPCEPEPLRDAAGAGEGQAVAPPACTCCGSPIRPGVVWFGEPLPSDAWQAAVDAVDGASLVVVVGSSGLVQPAASLPLQALRAGTPVLEINPAPTPLAEVATVSWRCTASAGLALLQDRLDHDATLDALLAPIGSM